MSSQLNQKKVAKNTLYLYIRMLMIMVVQFYTVRITLQVLGMENYGISNVVGGVTHIFTFLTHTMTSASQRFFAFDLGRKDLTSLKNTYGTMLIFFIALVTIMKRPHTKSDEKTSATELTSYPSFCNAS